MPLLSAIATDDKGRANMIDRPVEARREAGAATVDRRIRR